MSKKAVVTGGAGFIGSYLVRRLLEAEWNVLVLDAKETKCLSQENRDRFQALQVNISNSEVIEVIVTYQPDVVFHLAAQTSSVISEESPSIDIDSNLKGAINVAESVKRIEDCHLVFTSSMAVYGSEFDGKASGPKCAPTSIYGITKLASEFVFSRLRQYQRRVTIFRLFNVYGPGQDLTNLKQGMLSIFSAMAVFDRKICVKGNLERTRDFVHVSDVIDQLMSCVDSYSNFEIIEVGTGKETSVENLLAMICSLSKKLFGYEVDVEVDRGFAEDVQRSCSSQLNPSFRELDSGLEEFLLWAGSRKNEV